MKRLIIVTSLMVMTFIANSQILLEETKIWNDVECINFGGCWTYSFKVIGDTTINQVDYKKIYGISDSIKTNRGIYVGMREHEKQVFLYNLESETEEILYDFNLSVGETFNITLNSPEYYGCEVMLEVEAIDSVTLLNGEWRKRFRFRSGEEWIEGIGSLNGIFNVGVHMCGADMYYYLSCCHMNGEKIFQSDEFDHCYINTVGYEDISEQIKPVVYPNPFSEFTTFKFDYSSSHVYRLQIINGMGQLIQTIENINSSEIIIERNQLNTGIHFYRLFKENGEIVTGIFVVK